MFQINNSSELTKFTANYLINHIQFKSISISIQLQFFSIIISTNIQINDKPSGTDQVGSGNTKMFPEDNKNFFHSTQK